MNQTTKPGNIPTRESGGDFVHIISGAPVFLPTVGGCLSACAASVSLVYCNQKGGGFRGGEPYHITPGGFAVDNIKNLMSAIEQGIITPTTKERLEELEEERRDLEGQIALEEMKKPLLTKERIIYWLESFKRGNIKDVEYQRRIIDTLVNSVYVYDDGDKGRKLVLTFNISGNNTLTISSSDIERTAPPK